LIEACSLTVRQPIVATTLAAFPFRRYVSAASVARCGAIIREKAR
jgi:hypothetical protein